MKRTVQSAFRPERRPETTSAATPVALTPSAWRGVLWLALLAVAACGGPQAPACDTPVTRDLAAREAATLLAIRHGMRRVPQNPDRLAGEAGDTIRFTPGGGHVWVRHDEDRAVATLENVRSVSQDREEGAWICAADFVLARLSETPEAPLRTAIEYRSGLVEEGGRLRHYVRVIVP